MLFRRGEISHANPQNASKMLVRVKSQLVKQFRETPPNMGHNNSSHSRPREYVMLLPADVCSTEEVLGHAYSYCPQSLPATRW